jgi:hypothetical protein
MQKEKPSFQAIPNCRCRAPKQWNKSKEVPANQGSNAVGAGQIKLAFAA